MRRIMIAMLIVFSILLAKILMKVDCRKVKIIKFKEKGNYCVMFTRDGIIVDKKCYYGERIVCGVRNGNVTFSYLTILSG